jgi:hypothetical protein
MSSIFWSNSTDDEGLEISTVTLVLCNFVFLIMVDDVKRLIDMGSLTIKVYYQHHIFVE